MMGMTPILIVIMLSDIFKVESKVFIASINEACLCEIDVDVPRCGKMILCKKKYTQNVGRLRNCVVIKNCSSTRRKGSERKKIMEMSRIEKIQNFSVETLINQSK